MSNQTETLLHNPTQVFFEVDPNRIAEPHVDGRISNFQNSHYTDHEGLDQSVSYVVNNSGDCLWMFNSAGFGTEGVKFGPNTVEALTGDLAPYNDQFSSAFAVNRNSGYCDVGTGQYKKL